MKRRRVGSRCGGFTLVEMLVVLVLVALISGILLSALGQTVDLRQRLAAYLEGSEAPTLVAGWFRDSVQGLLADGGSDRFTGGPRGLAGLSVAPIAGPPGVPTPIRWDLTFDAASGRTELRYTASGRAPLLIASWPGDSGGFRYCGSGLACADGWPPEPDSPVAELPAVIRLDAWRGTQAWPILAAPRGARQVPPNAP